MPRLRRMSTFFAAVVLAEALSYPVAGQTETVELQLKYQRGEALFYHSDEADRDRKRSPPQHLGHLKNHGDAGAIIISAWRRVHRVPMRPDHDDAVGPRAPSFVATMFHVVLVSITIST